LFQISFQQDYLIASELMSVMTDSVESKKVSVSSSPSVSETLASKQQGHVSTGVAYFVFLMLTGVVVRMFSDRDFSTVLTLGSIVQCLGFFLLLQKVNMQKSVAGISSKMLEMYVLVFSFRLSSTLIKQGYLPIDRSGDWVYQAADIASLMVVFQLLWKVHKSYKVTYQSTHDTLNIWRAVPAAIALGIVFHGNLNKSAFFDTTWTIAMNLDTIAMLPQYWMLVKQAGEVEALTAHFVACIVVSRACACAFWYYGYKELAPKKNKKPTGGFNYAGWFILFCHGTQLMLSTDFMYHYVSSTMKKVKMVIPENCTFDI